MAVVLVVDDEFGVAELIKEVLSDEGYSVLTAASGRQGLEVMASHRPDLVFLDYMMPVMDGAALLRAMAANPSLGGIPVVVMSGLPEASIAERCVGYTTFIRKPFRIAELIALVKQLISTAPVGDVAEYGAAPSAESGA